MDIDSSVVIEGRHREVNGDGKSQVKYFFFKKRLTRIVTEFKNKNSSHLSKHHRQSLKIEDNWQNHLETCYICTYPGIYSFHTTQLYNRY